MSSLYGSERNNNPALIAAHHGKSLETHHLQSNEVSTGTTIMAIPFEGGVVLGADTRVSTGVYIANRTSDKIAQLHDYIWCARSGSASDCQALTDYVRHYLSQLSIEMGRPPTVKTAAHLMQRLCYQNKDMLLAGVIIGGWDPVDGGSVYNIPLGGSCIRMPFALGGSGSTFIYGLVDAKFRPDMSKDEALALVKKAIGHAMSLDQSSGGSIRTVTVMREEGGNDDDGSSTHNVLVEREYVPGDQLSLSREI